MELAELLQTDAHMISVWRRMAITDGYMEIVAEHTARRATRFQVNASFVAWLRELRRQRTS